MLLLLFLEEVVFKEGDERNALAVLVPTITIAIDAKI